MQVPAGFDPALSATICPRVRTLKEMGGESVARKPRYALFRRISQVRLRISCSPRAPQFRLDFLVRLFVDSSMWRLCFGRIKP